MDDSVSSSLLVQLRSRSPQAWERLARLYAPLIVQWCRRAELSAADAADVVQEVFAAAARGLEAFRRDRPGDSFHGWMATIARNKIRDHFRRVTREPPGTGGTSVQQRLQEAPDLEATASFSHSDAQAEMQGIVRRAAELVRSEIEPRTWEAFWRTAVDAQTPAVVSEELGLSVASVYQARSRVMRRLRIELDGLG